MVELSRLREQQEAVQLEITRITETLHLVNDSKDAKRRRLARREQEKRETAAQVDTVLSFWTGLGIRLRTQPDPQPAEQPDEERLLYTYSFSHLQAKDARAKQCDVQIAYRNRLVEGTGRSTHLIRRCVI